MKRKIQKVQIIYLMIVISLIGILIIGMLLLEGGQSDSRANQHSEKIVLSVLAGQSTSDWGIEDMIDKVVKEKYPNVELEWECVDWGDKFDSQLCARYASGNIPDIIIGKAQDAIVYSKVGYLESIEEDYSGLIEEEALDTVTVDGVVYGIPYNTWYQGVIYNKEIFEKYNLDIPKNQDDLEDIIEILQNNNITPFASHFLEEWSVGNMTMQFMMNEIFADQAEWGDGFREEKVSVSDSEEAIRCLEYNKNILLNSWDDALEIDQYESDKRFFEGSAAMYLTGSWSMQFATQYNEKMKIGIFPFPNEEGDARLIRETNLTFMQGANSKYQQLVSKILMTILENEALAEEILNYTSSASVVKGWEMKYESPLQEDIEKYADNNAVIDVSLGNTQLIWSYQIELAKKELSYLNGMDSLEEVLSYADSIRTDSGYYTE